MRKILPFILIASLFASCATEEDYPIEEAMEVEFRTDPSIKFFHATEEPNNKKSEHGYHHLLGHGYDATGVFVAESSARNAIFNLGKILQRFPDAVFEGRPRSQKGGNWDYPNGLRFLSFLSHGIDHLYGNVGFGKTIEAYFPEEDHSKNFVYSDFRIEMSYDYSIAILSPEDEFYTAEFLQAIQNHSPEEIVQAFGTHYVTGITEGALLHILYRTETDNPDRQEASNNGLMVTRHNIFKPLDQEVDYFVAEGNFNQQLSFKIKGGDRSKLHMAEVDEDHKMRIDFNEWFDSISEENTEMVGIRMAPIYWLVEDEEKQKNLKEYIEKYLKENEFQY